MKEGLFNKTTNIKKEEELQTNKDLLSDHNSIQNATTKDLKRSLCGYKLALSRLSTIGGKYSYQYSKEKIEENILLIEGELLNRKEMISQKFSPKNLENIDDILEWEKIHDEED